MTSPQQSSILSSFIRLQQIDDQRLRIERRIVEGPRLVEKRTQGERGLEEKLKLAHERVKKTRTTAHEQELELRSKETEIQRLQSQQNTARTNQEYKALGDHAERLKNECSGIEDRILQAFADLEKTQEEEKRLGALLETAQVESQNLREQWTKDEAEYRAELDRILAQRGEFVKQLPAAMLSIYETAARNSDGKAVVPVENNVCTGCRMRLVPNDLSRLHYPQELVLCKSCERIVFLP